MAELQPRDAAELRDIVAEAAARQRPLEIVGGATKRGLGRPLDGAVALSTASLTAATIYEPDELVLTASPALKMADRKSVV